MASSDESIESCGDELCNEEVVTTESLVLDETDVLICDKYKHQISDILGLVVAFIHILDGVCYQQNSQKFIVRQMIVTLDVIQELNQFKINMYLAFIERTNYFRDIRLKPEFGQYLTALDEMWSECLKVKEKSVNNNNISDSDRQLLTQLMDEMRFHKNMFQTFLKQMNFAIKGLELICGDVQSQQSTHFADIFEADSRLTSLRTTAEFFTDFDQKLNDRLNQLIKE